MKKYTVIGVFGLVIAALAIVSTMLYQARAEASQPDSAIISHQLDAQIIKVRASADTLKGDLTVLKSMFATETERVAKLDKLMEHLDSDLAALPKPKDVAQKDTKKDPPDDK